MKCECCHRENKYVLLYPFTIHTGKTVQEFDSCIVDDAICLTCLNTEMREIISNEE